MLSRPWSFFVKLSVCRLLNTILEVSKHHLETNVYRKPTKTGLLLQHQSHVDKRYKKSLFRTMLIRAFHLSSTWESFKSESDHLKVMFASLNYRDSFIKSTICHKIDHTLQPVFNSRKICEGLKMCEPKRSIISQQCVVYHYKCDLCDAEYVSYTSRHLHQRKQVIHQSANT